MKAIRGKSERNLIRNIARRAKAEGKLKPAKAPKPADKDTPR